MLHIQFPFELVLVITTVCMPLAYSVFLFVVIVGGWGKFMKPLYNWYIMCVNDYKLIFHNKQIHTFGLLGQRLLARSCWVNVCLLCVIDWLGQDETKFTSATLTSSPRAPPRKNLAGPVPWKTDTWFDLGQTWWHFWCRLRTSQFGAGFCLTAH